MDDLTSLKKPSCKSSVLFSFSAGSNPNWFVTKLKKTKVESMHWNRTSPLEYPSSKSSIYLFAAGE